MPPGADSQAKMYDSLTPRFDQVTRRRPEHLLQVRGLRRRAGRPREERARPAPRGEDRARPLPRPAHHRAHARRRHVGDGLGAAGGPRAAARAGSLRGAPRRRRRAQHQRVRPRHRAEDLHAHAQRRSHRSAATACARCAPPAATARACSTTSTSSSTASTRACGRRRARPKPFTRVDLFAFNALGGQIFGQGGGDEARRGQFYGALRARLGNSAAKTLFDDLSEHVGRRHADDPHAHGPLRPRPAERRAATRSSTPAACSGRSPRARARARARTYWASNFLIVGRKRSTTGHPLFVGGPQIGYFYPGLTLEADLRWPGHQARGVYSPAHPGTILIGRGEDFAWSLTSAGSDLIDEYAEILCGGSSTRYRYRGKCRKMGTVDAGTIAGEGQRPLPHHGPRPRDRLRHGRRQARRDRPQARELRPRRALAAAVPRRHDRAHLRHALVRQGVRALAVHVQRRLRRRPRHRDVLRRRAPAPRPARRPAAPDARHGRLRVARHAALAQAAAAGQPGRRRAAELEQQPRARLRRRGRQLGLRLAAPRVAAPEPDRPPAQARPRVGDERDERGGDAGPALDRADADALDAAARRARAERARPAHARAARGVARRRLEPPRPRRGRRDGRGRRARDHGRVLSAPLRRGAGRRARPAARRPQGARGRQERAAQLHRRRHQLHRQGPAPAARHAVQAAVPHPLLRRRRPRRVPHRDLERARRHRPGARDRAGRTRAPTPGSRTPRPSASSSRPGS